MKPTKKDLKKLAEKLDNQKHCYLRDDFMVGYNSGIDRAIQLVNELLNE